MNSVQLMGRLTRDPEIRYTNGGTSFAKFSLAVDRRFKQEGGPTADFINCTAFGKTAEFIEKYFSKGKMLALNGRIQTGNYTNNDGQKIYTTDVIVENVEFCGGRSDGMRDNDDSSSINTNLDENGFMSIPDGIEEELPFS